MRVEWLEQQLKDKDEMMKVLKGRLESAESHKVGGKSKARSRHPVSFPSNRGARGNRPLAFDAPPRQNIVYAVSQRSHQTVHPVHYIEGSMEGALEDARAVAARAEDRVSASAGEIRKGNQIIERLQAELRSAKAKAKLKAAVIAQQETLLSERQSALEKTAREQSELIREADAARAEVRALTARVDDQRKKLEESQALLVSNQQMIQWLNGQVNEAQLGRLGASSRYSFRPSAPLPTFSAAAGGGGGGASAGFGGSPGAAGPGPAAAGAAGGGGVLSSEGFGRGSVRRVAGVAAGDDAAGVSYKPRVTVPTAV